MFSVPRHDARFLARINKRLGFSLSAPFLVKTAYLPSFAVQELLSLPDGGALWSCVSPPIGASIDARKRVRTTSTYSPVLTRAAYCCCCQSCPLSGIR